MSPPLVGFRKFGVPPGGPYDRASAAQAARLPGAVRVWEFAVPCSFLVEADGMVGLAGAWRAPGVGCWAVTAGSVLEFGAPSRGVFSYLAESLLESPAAWWPSLISSSAPLRFWPGPDASLFDLSAFCGSEWVATASHSRMGLRLAGTPLTFSFEDRHSEPQVRGTIQVPPNGLPVLLGPDGPTVGGYAKLGVVVDADLDRVAQLAPGDVVRFSRV